MDNVIKRIHKIKLTILILRMVQMIQTVTIKPIKTILTQIIKVRTAFKIGQTLKISHVTNVAREETPLPPLLKTQETTTLQEDQARTPPQLKLDLLLEGEAVEVVIDDSQQI